MALVSKDGLFLTGADINGLPGPDARYFRVENGLISLTPA